MDSSDPMGTTSASTSVPNTSVQGTVNISVLSPTITTGSVTPTNANVNSSMGVKSNNLSQDNKSVKSNNLSQDNKSVKSNNEFVESMSNASKVFNLDEELSASRKQLQH